MTGLVRDAASGKLSAVVPGGYDFADVRDVAAGIIAAAERGRNGRAYLLTGEYMSAEDLANTVRRLVGKSRKLNMLPLWFAKITAPLAELYYKIRGTKPLFTRYSLCTLGSPSGFSHERATRELGYRPRPAEDTLRDTAEWLGGRN